MVYNRGPSPQYMTKMVSQEVKAVGAVLHIDFLLGEELVPSVTHLMPSVEVSQHWRYMIIIVY